MLQLSDAIFEAADHNKITALVKIDESVTFDCVPHWLLLQKLAFYNFDNHTLNWFSSYLSFRSQYVTINAKDSDMIQASTGVHQGSVLGPIMYTLFINELPEAIKDNNCMNSNHNQSESVNAE